MEVERRRRDLISEGFEFRSRDLVGFNASMSRPPPPRSPRSPSPSEVSSIEHRVSKLDTLAGIAIKYGVEVADIKRMNGLVTDLQIYAHKKLQIPLPGRHPPSLISSNGSASNGEQTLSRTSHNNMDPFSSLKLTPPGRRTSDAMNDLLGFNDLVPPPSLASEEGTEMFVYRLNKGHESQTPTLPRVRPGLDLPTGWSHIPTWYSEDNPGLVIGVAGEMDEQAISQSENCSGKHQVADANPLLGTPESVIKHETRGSASSRNGKGLALRPKSGSRTDLVSEGNGGVIVRKSSSTPNLEDSDSHSLWSASGWALNTDVITRPLLEGLTIPIAAFRKIKAARD